MPQIVRNTHLLMLIRYTLSGSIAAGVDLGLLYILRNANFSDTIAVLVSAGTATFVHYVICRYFVFRIFKRSFVTGLLYFSSIIGVSLALNISLYLVLSSFIMPDHFVVARIISIVVVGMLSFILNSHVTFQTRTLMSIRS